MIVYQLKGVQSLIRELILLGQVQESVTGLILIQSANVFTTGILTQCWQGLELQG